MADIGHEHLHHLASRLHKTNMHLANLKQKFSGAMHRGFGTLEVAAGSWIGGAIEGRTGGDTFAKIPYNMLIGAGLIGAAHFGAGGPEWSSHLNNLGNGFIGSYIAATGYAFGKRWKDTGKLLGGGGHPWSSPYDNGWHAAPPPAVHGDLSQAQMADIVQRMQAAAAHP